MRPTFGLWIVKVDENRNAFLCKVFYLVFNSERFKLNNIFNFFFIPNTDLDRSFNNVKRRTSYTTADFLVALLFICNWLSRLIIIYFSWTPNKVKFREESHLVKCVILLPLINYIAIQLTVGFNHYNLIIDILFSPFIKSVKWIITKHLVYVAQSFLV